MATQRVRTPYILLNVVTHLSSCPTMTFIPALNANEEKVFRRVLKLCKKIYNIHRFQIRLITRVFRNIEEDKVQRFLLDLYNKLFANRVSWSRILLFTSIVSTFMMPYTINDVLFLRFHTIVKDKLLPWIDDHDGWEAIEIDETLYGIPNVNFEDYFYRRSKRLASKEKVTYEKYF